MAVVGCTTPEEEVGCAADEPAEEESCVPVLVSEVAPTPLPGTTSVTVTIPDKMVVVKGLLSEGTMVSPIEIPTVVVTTPGVTTTVETGRGG